jgi:hypothetical protein
MAETIVKVSHDLIHFMRLRREKGIRAISNIPISESICSKKFKLFLCKRENNKKFQIL